MASMFEKPIAAQPMSEFVALPLDFIDKSLQRRNERYDTARAAVDEIDNSLLGMRYLKGDTQRHHEIQGQFDDELNAMVESSGGDYSQIQGQLDNFKRRLKRETTLGELGAQQSAYDAAGLMGKAERKKLSEGKSSQEGYNKFLRSTQEHVTEPTEEGGFNSFQGYMASTVVNPLKRLQDGADEINAKYNEEGMKVVSPKLIQDNLLNQISSDSNLYRALEEKVAGRTDAAGKPISVESYIAKIVSGVVRDKTYEEKAKATRGDGSTMKTTAPQYFDRIQQPEYVSGELGMTGGSVPFLRNLGKMAGRDSWRELDQWVGSPEGKARIEYMEWKTQTKMPEAPGEQAEWLQEHGGANATSSLQARGASVQEQKQVNNEGVFSNQNAAVRNINTGKLIKGDDLKAIQGSSKTTDGGGKRTTFVTSVVKEGGMYPPGSLIIVGHDGETYIQEPSNPKVLKSPEYNKALIDMTKNTNTGVQTITTMGDLPKMPKGVYTVEYMPKINEYKISQNGKPILRKFVKDGIEYIDYL